MIKSLKNSIPNLFTLANLSCGVLGIVLLFDGEPTKAAYLIWLAAGFDFLDGFLARILKAYSELGKQLDSLADLVTFGVLPSLIYFTLLKGQFDLPLEYLSFLVAILSALRLAKFNIDDSQKLSFKGLPTPASGILASAIPLILAGTTLLSSFLTNSIALLLLMLVSSVMMVTPITLISLKFNDFSFGKNWDKWTLVLGSLTMILLFRESSIPLIIGFYVLLSLLSSPNKKTTN